MDNLDKQQIILLALLVSFVSSIATGIVTVSLMEQGGQPIVTQTINRVVERTIEKVASGEDSSQLSVKETVIIRDDQALVSAIENVSKSIVRIYESRNGENVFIGTGPIISSEGKIVASFNNRYSGQSGNLIGILDGGNSVVLSLVDNNLEEGFYLLQADQSNDPLHAKAYTPVILGDSDKIKLGQSVALVANTESFLVESGIISSIDTENSQIYNIYPNIKEIPFNKGSIIINLQGEVIGMESIPSNIIKQYATP